MTYKFTGQLMGLKLKRGEITKTFTMQAERVVRAAAREWLRAVYVRIPVWTGMARGAIKFAKGRTGESSGQFLSIYLRVAVPIEPIIEVRKDKSPELGGKQS